MSTSKLFGAIGLLFMTGCNLHNTTPHATEQVHMHGPHGHMHLVQPTTADYEKDFLHRMSDHHQTASLMNDLVPQHASHQELLAMASHSSTSQQQQIEQMARWLSTWYQFSFTPHLTDEMKPDLDRLAKLPPDQFDREYLKAMIKHHQQGVDMAKPMITAAVHLEVRQLASTIVDEQSKEITELQDLLGRWYLDPAASGTK